MAWRLEIHHIGLDTKGDSTLILAINDGIGVNQYPQTRTMLIDGGTLGETSFVHDYIRRKLRVFPGGSRLDVLVVTHYDVDHFNGIRGLLNLRGPNIYDNIIIFDQGFSQGSQENAYRHYINATGSRWRPTKRILGWADPMAPRDLQGGRGLAPNYLVGREIMWTNANFGEVTPADLLEEVPGTNDNPPTVTCIAANQYVWGTTGRHGGIGVDLKNEFSLGFIVTFNNFKYYIAGDLETAQENHVQSLLNPTDDLAGRVVAIKTSHHGAATSTSKAFLDRLKPDAAFISCGNENQNQHPFQQVLNILDGYEWTAEDHAQAPPPSPCRPVPHYLTGYQEIYPQPLSFGDPDNSSTAGDPTATPRIPGHIILTVTEAQSRNDQRGESYIGVREAVRWAALFTETAELNANQIGEAAADAFAGAGINTRVQAVQVATRAAAEAAGAEGAVSKAATLAAATAATGWGTEKVNYNSSNIAKYTAEQTRRNDATPTQAAVAGAAAGAAFAYGERHSAASAAATALSHSGAKLIFHETWAAYLRCKNSITEFVGNGLFDVSFYDRLMQPNAGTQNINHTG